VTFGKLWMAQPHIETGNSQDGACVQYRIPGPGLGNGNS